MQQHRRADADGEAVDRRDQRLGKARDLADEIGARHFPAALTAAAKSPMSLPAENTPPAPAISTTPIDWSRSASWSATFSARYMELVRAFFLAGRFERQLQHRARSRDVHIRHDFPPGPFLAACLTRAPMSCALQQRRSLVYK